MSDQPTGFEIAVIGLAGRFPGARDVHEYWRNLRDGVESISFFSDDELLEAGVDPALVREPNCVKAGGILADEDKFDASFFGITPREAELIDPQQRFFLECAWEALEDAGCDPARYPGPIGVFAGVSRNTYFLLNVHGGAAETVRGLPVVLASDSDFLTTRVSYKLDLKGPSLDIQTACSTSLVAIHIACQNLLSGECDVALAGGVSLMVPQVTAFRWMEGGTYSRDGHCRAFDAQAMGIVGANGVGIVVLKRLADALADGDSIRAVIKGSAINNDGSGKVGFTAPSVDGQAQVIARALAMAEVHPESISYVETHGTGTALGDPIEIAGLSQAFRARSSKTGFCALGAVKTNIGHTNAAAGAAGLIKTVLALQQRQLPPTLHFESPNPNIDFANSPFFVNATLRDWPAGNTPRRAGVSSFGMGGTNAHVVVEEAPPASAAAAARPWQLLVLSARSRTALDAATARLRDHLAARPDAALADVAFTLQTGRKRHAQRRFIVCRDVADACSVLERLDPKRTFSGAGDEREPVPAFMFTGQGSQYAQMGRQLYDAERVFREQVDRGAELLRPLLGLDLREALYPGEARAASAAAELTQTALTQPALFVVEHALAQLWMSWGVRPQAMIGHSIGEYVAACLAGVFSFEDGLGLVAARGRLMQDLPRGAMLAVPRPAGELEALLGERLALAAVNEDSASVVSGPEEAVAELEARLAERAVACQRLHTSHAFHSAMMDPILEPFSERVAKVALRAPGIPYVSNLTGTWITAEQATDPRYWARHLRGTVRFAAGIATLFQEPARLLLEVGPGRTLTTLASRHKAKAPGHVVVSSLRHPTETQDDVAFLLHAAGRLWAAGMALDWGAFHGGERRRRVPLPTYPFERQRYWLDATSQQGEQAPTRLQGKNPDVSQWFWAPSWRRSVPPAAALRDGLRWLLFADRSGLAERLARRLEQAGQEVALAHAGTAFGRTAERTFALDPASRDDHSRLIQTLLANGGAPSRIVHVWGVDAAENGDPEAALRAAQRLGFYSLALLAQALGDSGVVDPAQLVVITAGAQDVTGTEPLRPERATALGPCKVIPQEYPNLRCRSVDVVAPESGGWDGAALDLLFAELASEASDEAVAYRGGHRWVQSFERLRLEAPTGRPSRLREGGVYLVTGGLGGIGLEVADYLARTVRARLVLVSRNALPERSEWTRWLAEHPSDELNGRRIRRLQALESLGAELLPLVADVADAEAMSRVVQLAERRFGALHGVVHAAGAERYSSPIAESGPAEWEQQFRPRLQAALALERALEGRRLDFCLLQSSLSAVLGAVGSAAYTASHVFLDAFAACQSRRGGTPWLSADWDRWLTWREGQGSEAERAELFMTAEEAQDAFARVLSAGSVNQIVVSTGDLEARIDRWIKLRFLRETEAQAAPGSSLHARPELSQAFVAPANPTEETLARIWQETLGIAQVGRQDDFFELGGDSVLGLQIVAKANQAGLRLSARQIFEHPTIAELASVASAATAPAVPAASADTDQAPVAPEEARFPAARLNQKELDDFMARFSGGQGTPAK